jgi:hypothetical protein
MKGQDLRQPFRRHPHAHVGWRRHERGATLGGERFEQRLEQRVCNLQEPGRQ